MRRELDAQEILQAISTGRTMIEAASEGLSDAQVASRPEPEEWSPLEILAHLRACAAVWGDQRIGRMLDEDEPTIRSVNPRRWIRSTDYPEIPFCD